MLGHADIKQTQRYLNITDEELRKAMTGVWERRRQLRSRDPQAALCFRTGRRRSPTAGGIKTQKSTRTPYQSKDGGHHVRS
jgi:hypothetical protein